VHERPDGFLQVVRPAQDVIKSGGEWISSIDIEKLMVGPSRRRRGRGDRPAAIPVGRATMLRRGRQGKAATSRPRDALLGYLSDKRAKWMLPDDVVWSLSCPTPRRAKLLKGQAAASIARGGIKATHRVSASTSIGHSPGLTRRSLGWRHPPAARAPVVMAGSSPAMTDRSRLTSRRDAEGLRDAPGLPAPYDLDGSCRSRARLGPVVSTPRLSLPRPRMRAPTCNAEP